MRVPHDVQTSRAFSPVSLSTLQSARECPRERSKVVRHTLLMSLQPSTGLVEGSVQRLRQPTYPQRPCSSLSRACNLPDFKSWTEAELETRSGFSRREAASTLLMIRAITCSCSNCLFIWSSS